MNDWPLVGFSALWILGLSVVLTALGFADFHASREGRRLREVLARHAYQAGINLGLTLFCLGLIGSARATWERVVWALLSLAFALQVWTARKVWGVAGQEAKVPEAPEADLNPE